MDCATDKEKVKQLSVEVVQLKQKLLYQEKHLLRDARQVWEKDYSTLVRTLETEREDHRAVKHNNKRYLTEGRKLGAERLELVNEVADLRGDHAVATQQLAVATQQLAVATHKLSSHERTHSQQLKRMEAIHRSEQGQSLAALVTAAEVVIAAEKQAEMAAARALNAQDRAAAARRDALEDAEAAAVAIEASDAAVYQVANLIPRVPPGGLTPPPPILHTY